MKAKCVHRSEDGGCPFPPGRCWFDDLMSCTKFEQAPEPRKPRTVKEAAAEGQPDMFQ